jgi:type I restriction enzyme M protein
LRDKVLFINADREFAEGKNQNKLRPEDIEKIDYVFTHKRELPKYSRLVDKDELVEQHDHNLNIRRYVDNTPEPEPENVQAHLVGGIPQAEIVAKKAEFDKFGVQPEIFFEPLRLDYYAFRAAIDAKPDIKTTLEADAQLQAKLAAHHTALEQWWQVAQHDFAQLREGRKLPEVRSELLATLKAKLQPLGVLDQFKSAGVFVNWWQAIRYDLKTVLSTGWHHTLIPDSYLIAEYFQQEADEIEALEGKINEAQCELTEAVEAAAESASYEPEEAEGEEGEAKLTATAIKKYLKALIDDLADAKTDSAIKEHKKVEDLRDGISAIEARIKTHKTALKTGQDELELKLRLKRMGGDEANAETRELITQAEATMKSLNPAAKEEKKRLTALEKDKASLAQRLARIDDLLTTIGGRISEQDAKRLILKKLHDIATKELLRYLNAEKRALLAIVEDLWGKYAVSSQALEAERESTLSVLNGFLAGLGYLS